MVTSSLLGLRDTRRGRAGVVELGFTDARLDLGDQPDSSSRADALAAIAAETGALPVVMSQVHGAEVAALTQAPPTPPRVDALVTDRVGLALLTRSADCVPVLIADPDAGLIAAVHAGRAGVASGVVSVTIEDLRRRGAARLTAWVGPHVCGRCYEVPEEMRAEVAALVPATYAETRRGTPALDLGAGVRAQLVDQDCEVVDLARCTLEDPGLHSHRRDGAAAGRQAGVIWRRRA